MRPGGEGDLSVRHRALQHYRELRPDDHRSFDGPEEFLIVVPIANSDGANTPEPPPVQLDEAADSHGFAGRAGDVVEAIAASSPFSPVLDCRQKCVGAGSEDFERLVKLALLRQLRLAHWQRRAKTDVRKAHLVKSQYIAAGLQRRFPQGADKFKVRCAKLNHLITIALYRARDLKRKVARKGC